MLKRVYTISNDNDILQSAILFKKISCFERVHTCQLPFFAIFAHTNPQIIHHIKQCFVYTIAYQITYFLNYTCQIFAKQECIHAFMCALQ